MKNIEANQSRYAQHQSESRVTGTPMKATAHLALTILTASLCSSCIQRERCAVCETEATGVGASVIVEVCGEPDETAEQIQSLEDQGYICNPSN